MKQLFLLRHAKAVSEDSQSDDKQRSLNKRGLQAASDMGQWLKKNYGTVQQVLCSSAVRTTQTWQQIEEIWPADAVSLRDDMYLASPGECLSFINQLPEDKSSVMMVGHNPGMHWLAGQLAGDGDQDAIERLTFHFPTCALAILNVDKAWSEIVPGAMILDKYVTPDWIKRL